MSSILRIIFTVSVARVIALEVTKRGWMTFSSDIDEMVLWKTAYKNTDKTAKNQVSKKINLKGEGKRTLK
jgi:hypothetical protein